MNAEQFQKNGYCIVRSAISEELRDFVTQYTLFDEMQDDAVGRDLQVPTAHSKYADPVMETVLLKLQEIMEKNTGLTLHPTYSYYRIYRNGDELIPHVDRPSCEISATLCFNYSYDDNKYQWPIFMDGIRIDLKPGDLVIYRGCDLPHWREKFDIKEDSWHVQGFFHYVNSEGPCKDWKFDRRENIGMKREDQVTKSNNRIEKPYIEYTK